MFKVSALSFRALWKLLYSFVDWFLMQVVQIIWSVSLTSTIIFGLG